MAKKKTADACPAPSDELETFEMTEETRIELSNNRGEDEDNE